MKTKEEMKERIEAFCRMYAELKEDCEDSYKKGKISRELYHNDMAYYRGALHALQNLQEVCNEK